MNNEQAYLAEIERLKKINTALITRIEAGPDGAAAYDSFAHSVFLANQVRNRTSALNEAMQQLAQSNRQLLLAQEAATLANHSRTKLMSAISHDIMQPVCAAQLMLANLINQSNSADTRQQLAITNNAIQDIEQLLQDLLDYAREDNHDLSMNLSATNLHELVANLASEITPFANAKGLQVIYQPQPATGLTDANLLTRILRNLLHNAIRYTHKGNIKVVIEQLGLTTKVIVEDTGIGFQEDIQGQIFEPFHKLSNHSNTDGLGLGLANVKKLCDLLGHKLDYTSELNKGSRFELSLASATTIKPATNKLNPAGTIAFSQRILIIDNVAKVCKALGNLLAGWGAQTSCCYQLEDLDQEHFSWAQVVIIDYHLQDQLTGVQLLKRYNLTCPVLFITASSQANDLDTIKQAGYTYLNKPIKPARLRRSLDNLLSQ